MVTTDLFDRMEDDAAKTLISIGYVLVPAEEFGRDLLAPPDNGPWIARGNWTAELQRLREE